MWYEETWNTIIKCNLLAMTMREALSATSHPVEIDQIQTIYYKNNSSLDIYNFDFHFSDFWIIIYSARFLHNRTNIYDVKCVLSQLNKVNISTGITKWSIDEENSLRITAGTTLLDMEHFEQFVKRIELEIKDKVRYFPHIKVYELMDMARKNTEFS